VVREDRPEPGVPELFGQVNHLSPESLKG